jgi:hypothetical protein
LRKDLGDGTYVTETGWGNGDPMVERGNWATYFGIEFTCGDVPPGLSSETAFAYGCEDATCFIDLTLDGGFSRWGWTNYFTEPGVYYLDIYAGAGQCDITKGTLVGELRVDYDGTDVSVKYTTCGEYVMSETHLYVGSYPLALDVNSEPTVAPGQYPYIHEDLDGVQEDVFTTDEIVLTRDEFGGFYVVAHAVVWGNFDEWGDCGEVGCDYCVPGFDNDAFEAALDDFEQDEQVILRVAHQGGSATQPYFRGSLDGVRTNLPVYCIDLANTIYSNRDYCARLFSTYDAEMPAGVVHPENLDKVNYVLNSYSIGDLAGDNTAFTGGDIQRAIWSLAYGTLPSPGAYSSGPSSNVRVQEILDAALAYVGEYEPPCDGIVGVIIYPVDCNSSAPQQNLVAQMLVTEFESICNECP